MVWPADTQNAYDGSTMNKWWYDNTSDQKEH